MLSYHKVGPSSVDGWVTWNYVSEENLARNLEELLSSGFEFINLETFLRGLSNPAGLPRLAALLTFDDGYACLRGSALRVLDHLSCPAVVFVPTAYVGGWNRFDDGIEPRESMCDWEALRDLEARGWSVESHGVSHRTFSTLSSGEASEEMRCSKERIEQTLHKRVRAFAFPYGDAGDPNVSGKLLAEAGYEAAFLYGTGPQMLPAAERFRLNRIAVGPGTDVGAEALEGEKRGFEQAEMLSKNNTGKDACTTRTPDRAISRSR